MYPRLAVLALLSATNALAPPNVHHVPDFESARRELASSSSLVNAIVVEKSAAAVPAEAWAVSYTHLTLPTKRIV